MSEFFTEVNSTPYARKALKHTPKPYWTEELSELWKELYIAKKCFIKTSKEDHRYQSIFTEFKERRHTFDKTLK